MRLPAPIANGLRTDHPVLGLPFVDDRLLPLDSPCKIEEIGRGRGDGLWGRMDLYGNNDNEWRAFTTDATNSKYAWLVTHHPINGTSVLLYLDKDVVTAYSYMDYDNNGIIPLVVRAGGYWSDGESWLRPTSKLDPVTGERTWDKVPNPRPVMAHEIVDQATRGVTSGKVWCLDEFSSREIATEDYSVWMTESFGAWLAARAEGAIPLERCIVTLEALELSAGQLLNNIEAAKVVNIEPATWRSYVSRGQAPTAQAGWLAGGRPQWSPPVVQAWASRRNRDEQSQHISAEVHDRSLPIVERVAQEFTQLGRKMRKITRNDGASAVRSALRRKVIGLSLYDHVPAEMHASWLVDEFRTGSISGLGDHAMDQLISLMWLSPEQAKQAMQSFVAKGMKRGYERKELEETLLKHPLIMGSSSLHLQVQGALLPQWG